MSGYDMSGYEWMAEGRPNDIAGAGVLPWPLFGEVRSAHARIWCLNTPGTAGG